MFLSENSMGNEASLPVFSLLNELHFLVEAKLDGFGVETSAGKGSRVIIDRGP